MELINKDIKAFLVFYWFKNNEDNFIWMLFSRVHGLVKNVSGFLGGAM